MLRRRLARVQVVTHRYLLLVLQMPSRRRAPKQTETAASFKPTRTRKPCARFVSSDERAIAGKQLAGDGRSKRPRQSPTPSTRGSAARAAPPGKRRAKPTKVTSSEDDDSSEEESDEEDDSDDADDEEEQDDDEEDEDDDTFLDSARPRPTRAAKATQRSGAANVGAPRKVSHAGGSTAHGPSLVDDDTVRLYLPKRENPSEVCTKSSRVELDGIRYDNYLLDLEDGDDDRKSRQLLEDFTRDTLEQVAKEVDDLQDDLPPDCGKEQLEDASQWSVFSVIKGSREAFKPGEFLRLTPRTLQKLLGRASQMNTRERNRDIAFALTQKKHQQENEDEEEEVRVLDRVPRRSSTLRADPPEMRLSSIRPSICSSVRLFICPSANAILRMRYYCRM